MARLMNVEPTITIPSVDDWWALTLEFPDYQRITPLALKDYGYMAVMSAIHQRLADQKLRVLEFGHLFNATLFRMFGELAETWGIDDIGTEAYVPPVQIWEKRFKEQMLDPCPKTQFVRGYLGRDRDKLPSDYFDIICSISVYDNIKREYWPDVTEHSFLLLKTGGLFINTFDFMLRHQKGAVERFVETQRKAGFELPTVPPAEASDHLIENQSTVMVTYQQNEPRTKERKYRGNYGTVLTIARKPRST